MKHPSFDYVLAGLLLAAALVLPVLFHLLGLSSAFMPMFYPLALAGFLVATPLAMITGVAAPLVSALLTGMPPFYPPIAFIMMAEGLLFTGLPRPLQRLLRAPDWLVLLVVLLLDRVLLLMMVRGMAVVMELPPVLLGWASLLHGLPGLALMLAVLPWLIPQLQARKERIARRHDQA
ncbi:MAG: hypothetical protein MUF02_09235 [Acidobacteria bacterium]|jgi:hypothetical protein|nr:hypothetical protein [Acidobacteriota bacterium]